MSMPAFTAAASLYQTGRHYEGEPSPLGSPGLDQVLAQNKSETDAQHVKDMLKFGEVHCDWITYCTGNMGSGNQNCGIKKVCYWWPW